MLDGADAMFDSLGGGARPKGYALKTPITIERTSKVKITPSPNVIGILPGTDPKLKHEYVVLSAHLDHEGVDPNLPGKDKIYNGAMDNAGGIATMLEAARAFAESKQKPKRSILFVALTAEEDGLLGSEYLAKYPVVGPKGRFIADVNLDMPILLYDFKDVVAFGAEHSTLGPIVERAAGRIGVKTRESTRDGRFGFRPWRRSSISLAARREHTRADRGHRSHTDARESSRRTAVTHL